MIIRSNSSAVDFARLKGGKLIELNKEIEDNKFSVGDIFVAKIRKSVSGLNASFINVGHQKDGFLHYHDLGPKVLSLIKYVKLVSAGKQDEKFAHTLVTWADVIRKPYNDGGVDEIISTRRLVHIAEAYGIFRNKMKAIAVCTNRFDDDTKTSFTDLYTKVDSGASVEQILEDKKNAEEAEILNEKNSDDDEDGEEEDMNV